MPLARSLLFCPHRRGRHGDPVKIFRLRLRNDSSRPRRLTATFFAAWVLGSVREDQQLHVTTSRDEESGGVVARQFWTGWYRGRWHLRLRARAPRVVGGPSQFLGRNGSILQAGLAGTCTAGQSLRRAVDPAAALQVAVSLDPGGETEVIFLLGQAGNLESVRAIISRYRQNSQVEGALAATREWWESTLSVVKVKTPVLSIDLMLNGWLFYQALSCRFWGRSALYQSSGAIGFRDQLQDCLAFVYTGAAVDPTSHSDRGSAAIHRRRRAALVAPRLGQWRRTRCSDDLLWLPFVVAQYVRVTGDRGILDEMAPSLEGPVLANGEMERMFAPPISAQPVRSGSIAGGLSIMRGGWDRTDLPLIGTCDWNDGMNLVGAEGQRRKPVAGLVPLHSAGCFRRSFRRPHRAAKR